MKIAAMSIVYNEEPLIEGCIKSLQGIADKHLFMVSTKPFYGEEQEPDNSVKVIEALGGEVIEGYWPKEHHMRNDGLSELKDYDFVITTDADMWLTQRTATELRSLLENNLYGEAFIAPQVAYWKDTDHILMGDDFMPVIAVRKGTKFVHIGNVDKTPTILPILIHHINWCAPKDILKKVLCYSHAPEFDGLNWYNQYYLPWKEGEKAVLPNKRFDVLFSPLPPELKSYIKEKNETYQANLRRFRRIWWK